MYRYQLIPQIPKKVFTKGKVSQTLLNDSELPNNEYNEFYIVFTYRFIPYFKSLAYVQRSTQMIVSIYDQQLNGKFLECHQPQAKSSIAE